MLCQRHWSETRPFRGWTLTLSLNPYYLMEFATTGLDNETEVSDFLHGHGNANARIHEVSLLYPDGRLDSYYRGKSYLSRIKNWQDEVARGLNFAIKPISN